MVIAVLLFLGGCGSSATPPEEPPEGSTEPVPEGPVEGGTLHLSMFTPPRGVFNPILYEDVYDGNIIGMVFNGLMKPNEKLVYVPDLAEEMTVSEDNQTVTFKLKKGVKWHDGVEFTAKDVAFTFRTILHPDYTGVRTDGYKDLVGVSAMLTERARLDEEVEAGALTADAVHTQKMEDWDHWLEGAGKQAINVIDAHTISFTTDEPFAPLVQELAASIIPAHIFEGFDVAKLEEHPATRKPVGTGPYKMVDYKSDQYVELVRNESYYGGLPFIEKIIYKVVNQDVAIGQLMAGELDHMDIKPDQLDVLRDSKDLVIKEYMDFGYQYMGMKHDHPILQDPHIRQALMYGLDRKSMVQGLLMGHGTIMNSHMPPVSWAYDDGSINTYDYDPAKAKQLLADAGWTEKNAEGYLVKDGNVLEFTLRYPSGNKVREASAPLIQDDFKKIGVKINLEMMEFTTLSKIVFDDRGADLWLMGWSLSLDPDPGQLFLPNNKWGKVTGWTSPRNEELVQEGVRVFDQKDRKPIYVEWAKLLNEELPYIFLYSQNQMHALNSRVKGWQPDVRGPFWNIHEMWLAGGQ